MRRGDGSLVLFTTLSQWSIGIVLCLTGLILFSSDDVVLASTGVSLANPIFLALALIIVATILSFLHLGNPVNAPKTLNNLATSWLSREILGIGLYTLSVAALFADGWTSAGPDFTPVLLLATSLAGMFLLWTMTRVYLLPTVPGWNSRHTPLGFAATTVSLGLVTCLALGMAGHIRVGQGIVETCTAVLIGVLLLEAGAAIMRRKQLAGMETGFDGPRFDQGMLRTLFRVRMVLLLVVVPGLVLFALVTAPADAGSGFAWFYLLLLMVVLQEVAARMLFYGSYFRVGL